MWINCISLFANVIFMSSKFKGSFLKILIWLFFNTYQIYLSVLVCGNILGNFKVLTILFTKLICLALDVCYVLMSCCSLPNFIFLLIVAGICSEVLSVEFFYNFICYFMCYTPNENIICNSWYIFFQFFNFVIVFFLLHAFCVTYEFHHCAQLVRF